MTQKILIWYRNDLRLHDHEPIHTAVKADNQIVPVYCFDPRQFGKTAFGFPKTGSFRAQFIIESVINLRHNLKQLGCDLVVRFGHPETEIAAIAQQLKIDKIYYHKEATSEEIAVENNLKNSADIPTQSFWGATLYHLEDLPFPIQNIPEVFTQFRKKIEKQSTVYPPFPTPQKLPPLPDIEPGSIPPLQELGLAPPVFDSRAVLNFQGGETAGLARLNRYLWERDCLKNYKQTRNGMLGSDYSSKFSPWLALGCLSPRFIDQQVREYEENRVKNDSTYWLIFELLWRDYFRFICLKHGDKIFRTSGLQGVEIPWREDGEQCDRWRFGMTGFPLVDANMRELAATGFMSNRGRQNVASFLTKNLGINWQIGAEWFESLLIDYDVCSNWGNWNYTAGVGNDARGFRYFNIPKQSKDYDPKGEYVKHWLPELSTIPPSKIHAPWTLSNAEQQQLGVRLGVNYPNPMVDLQQSVRDNRRVYERALSSE